MPGDPIPRSEINARPLVDALTKIAEAGRARVAAGTNDAAVEYARVANAALLWMEADDAGQLDVAERHLNTIHRAQL